MKIFQEQRDTMMSHSGLGLKRYMGRGKGQPANLKEDGRNVVKTNLEIETKEDDDASLHRSGDSIWETIRSKLPKSPVSGQVKGKNGSVEGGKPSVSSHSEENLNFRALDLMLPSERKESQVESSSKEVNELKMKIVVLEETLKLRKSLAEQSEENLRAKLHMMRERMSEESSLVRIAVILYLMCFLFTEGLRRSSLQPHVSAGSVQLLGVLATTVGLLVLASWNEIDSAVGAEDDESNLTDVSALPPLKKFSSLRTASSFILSDQSEEQREELEQFQSMFVNKVRSDLRVDSTKEYSLPSRYAMLAALQDTNFDTQTALQNLMESFVWNLRIKSPYSRKVSSGEVELFNKHRGREIVGQDKFGRPVLFERLGHVISKKSHYALSTNQWIRTHMQEINGIANQLQTASIRAKQPVNCYIHVCDLSGTSFLDLLFAFPILSPLTTALRHAHVGIRSKLYFINPPRFSFVFLSVFGRWLTVHGAASVNIVKVTDLPLEIQETVTKCSVPQSGVAEVHDIADS